MGEQPLMEIKALGFDFFGTLVRAEAEAETCIHKICKKLLEQQVALSQKEFYRAYEKVASEYREKRLSTLREVSNCVLLTDTLNQLGYEVKGDSQIIQAVEAYFGQWTLTVYPDAWKAVHRLNETYRMGLISNFTYTPYLRRSLTQLGLERYFDFVLVSEEFGWRKPHPQIFNRFLDLMGVEAEEALFVGDEPISDILGAKGAGMKATLIVRDSGKHSGKQAIYEPYTAKPDYVINSLIKLEEILKRV